MILRAKRICQERIYLFGIPKHPRPPTVKTKLTSSKAARRYWRIGASRTFVPWMAQAPEHVLTDEPRLAHSSNFFIIKSTSPTLFFV